MKNGFKKKVRDQGLLIKRLGELLQRGYTVSEAIDFLFYDEKEYLGIVKDKLLSGLQNGESLSEVMQRELNLPNHVCAQIYFAEHHGKMAETFYEVGKYLINKKKDRQQLFKILQYPMILIGIVIILLVLLRKVLFPSFQSLYSSLGYTPSSTINIVLSVIQVLPIISLWLFLIFILLFVTVLYIYKKIPPLEIARFISTVPGASKPYRLMQTHFLSRELGFLLGSGVSVYESLQIIQSQKFRPLFQQVAKRIMMELKEGKTFSHAVGKFPFFQKELLYIIQHGQMNGRLGEELEYYSKICLQQIEEDGKRFIGYIQPVVFCIVGIFILSIYFSIMMPLFQMMQSIM
jgi:competence protein ComGB